jgi:hypothetical protein
MLYFGFWILDFGLMSNAEDAPPDGKAAFI